MVITLNNLGVYLNGPVLLDRKKTQEEVDHVLYMLKEKNTTGEDVFIWGPEAINQVIFQPKSTIHYFKC